MIFLCRKLTILLSFFICINLSVAEDGIVGIQTGIDLLESQQFDEALEFFSSCVSENASSDSAHFYYGQALFIKGDYSEAIDEFEKAVELNGQSSFYHQWLGDALIQRTMQVGILKKPGYAKKAYKAWSAAVELDPDNIDARYSLIQYCLGAPGFMGGGQDKALEQAEEIVQRDPLLGRRALAQVYTANEQYDLAEAEYLQYLEAAPDDTITAFSLGLMYHSAEQWEKAMQLFVTLAQEHPTWLAAWYQVGRTGALSGLNVEKSADALKLYLSFEPDENEPSHAHAHFRLGNVYEKAGRIEEAKKEYETAIELDSSQKEFKKALKRCK